MSHRSRRAAGEPAASGLLLRDLVPESRSIRFSRCRAARPVASALAGGARRYYASPGGRCQREIPGILEILPTGAQGPDKGKGPRRAPWIVVGTREAPCASTTSYPPTDSTAVLSAMAGLTAEFGTESGDPCLHGRARAGRCPRARTGPPGGPGSRMRRDWRPRRRTRTCGRAMRRARPISTARLRPSRTLQLRPINPVVYRGPYRRESSSRRRLPA